MSIHTTSSPLARHGVALLSMVLGSSFALGSVVLMNLFTEAPEKRDVQEGTAIQITKTPKPKPKQEVKKPKPKPKSTPKAPPPPSLAALAGGLGGFALDLPGFDMSDMGGGAGDLLGGNSDITHTSDTVDVAPVATQQGQLTYPARLRQQGIEGYVVVGALINAQGAVERVSVVESRPAGAFDDVALGFVRSWRFKPARYKGEAVPIWIEQQVTFKLGT